MLEKFVSIREKVDEINDLIKDGEPKDVTAFVKEIRRISCEILEEL